jgi:hypothetical protein
MLATSARMTREKSCVIVALVATIPAPGKSAKSRARSAIRLNRKI